MGKAIEERLRPEAKERIREGARHAIAARDGCGHLPQPSLARPRLREQAAEAVGKAIEERLRPEAEKRRREGAKRAVRVREGLEEGSHQRRKPSDRSGVAVQAAQAVDMGESTYHRAKKVVEAAEDESLPEEARRGGLRASLSPTLFNPDSASTVSRIPRLIHWSRRR